MIKHERLEKNTGLLLLFTLPMVILIEALNDEEVCLMTNVLRIHGITRTLAEREEIEGIEQVRLPHAIVSEEAVQLR